MAMTFFGWVEMFSLSVFGVVTRDELGSVAVIVAAKRRGQCVSAYL